MGLITADGVQQKQIFRMAAAETLNALKCLRQKQL